MPENIISCICKSIFKGKNLTAIQLISLKLSFKSRHVDPREFYKNSLCQ